MAGKNRQDRMPYFIYLCEQRILAQNIDGHVIDLGAVTQKEGAFAWLLDGSKAHGEGFASEEEVLDDVTDKVDFLFLDGQFTSLPDLADRYSAQLDGAPSREVILHELNDEGVESER